MKIVSTLISGFLSLTALSAQELKNVDFISPFYEGLAAVQLEDRWGFIDYEGTLVIDYRSDLVALPCDTHPQWKFPKFSQGRTPIKSLKNDIVYYGVIDRSGTTIIEPSLINIPHFNEDGIALVQKLHKDAMGSNSILKKNLVRYTYTEEAVDTMGNTLGYLSTPKHILPYTKKMKKSPPITALLLSKDWAATQNEDKTYNLIRLNPTQNN